MTDSPDGPTLATLRKIERVLINRQPDKLEDALTMTRDLIARADTRPASAAVRGLEWDEGGYGWAETPWGGYSIVDRADNLFGWQCSSRTDSDVSDEGWPTVGEARQAADRDHARRILSALSPAPVEGLIEAVISAAVGLADDESERKYVESELRAALAAYEERGE